MSAQQTKHITRKDTKARKRARSSLSPGRSQELRTTQTKRRKALRHPDTLQGAISQFNIHKSACPEYVCTVCHRLMYKQSVIEFVPSKYNVSATFLAECTTGLISANNK